MQRLDHPGIVQLLEIHPRNGEVPLCLEYEFVDGVDLGAWYLSQSITEADRPAFVAGIIAELAEILHAAHSHQSDSGRNEPIVHRDLKPANVLVPRTPRGGRMKITDFGIGGILRAAEEAQQITRQRALSRDGSSYTLGALGAYTPGYCSPQQRRGDPADPRDDVYALGVIWFRMCMRELSREPGTDYADDLQDANTPAEHIALIGRCVAQRVDKRPKDAGALADEVRKLIAEAPSIKAAVNASSSIASANVVALATPAIAAPSLPAPYTAVKPVGSPPPEMSAPSVPATRIAIRGQSKRVGENYDGCIADCSEAITLDPKCAFAWQERGEAKRMKGDCDGCIADCTEAIRLDSKSSFAWASRGDAKRMKGDHDGSIADCTEAIRLDARNAFAWRVRGESKRMKSDYDGCIADCTEMIRLDPTSTSPWICRAESKRIKGDFDGCIADCTEAIRLDPNAALAWGIRGRAWWSKGRRDAAAWDLRRGHELDPSIEWIKKERDRASPHGG